MVDITSGHPKTSSVASKSISAAAITSLADSGTALNSWRLARCRR
jgi:hypothetical protein